MNIFSDRDQQIRKVTGDDGRFVEQQPLNLSGDATLRLQIERLDILGDKIVVSRAPEMRGVPGAFAEQRIAEKHVRHAAMGVIGNAERTVEPIRLAGDSLAVIGFLRLDLEIDPDTRGLRETLNKLRVLGNIGVLLGR